MTKATNLKNVAVSRKSCRPLETRIQLLRAAFLAAVPFATACGGHDEPTDAGGTDAASTYDVYAHLGECCADESAEGGPGSIPLAQCVPGPHVVTCADQTFCAYIASLPQDHVRCCEVGRYPYLCQGAQPR